MASEEACRRLKILVFWETHDLAASCDAFGVSRRTRYGWGCRYREGGGKSAVLEPRSRAQHRRRERQWAAAVISGIKLLRRAHPNLGQAKVQPLLARYCVAHGLSCPE
ncbi:MAG: hypothetical protein ACRES7_06930 [Gammaproteobacteria bacterium]